MAYVRKRGNRWYYTVNYYDKDGTRHRHEEYGGATKEEALRSFRLHVRQRDITGRYTKPENMPLADFMDEWLEKQVKVNNKPSTYDLYKSITVHHINPALGARALKDVKTRDIQDFLLNYKESGAAKSSVKVCLSVFRAAFLWAFINREYLLYSPAKNVIMPKFDDSERTSPGVFSPEEINIIFSAYPFGSKLFIPIRIAYYTGMRKGEVLALTWQDIDLNNRIIKVNKTLYDKKGAVISQPKTPGSFRTVSFGNKLLAAFRQQITWQAHNAAEYDEYYTPSPYVCTRDDGTPETSNDIRAFEKFCVKHFGGHSFHTFRHTHATRLIASGQFPVEYVSKRLGHASVAVTSDIYYTVSDDEARRAADRMEDIL